MEVGRDEAGHGRCPPGHCQLGPVPSIGWPMDVPETAAPVFRRIGFRVEGTTLWLTRCPASYVTAFTRQMLTAYAWLDMWHKTPVDLGVAADEVDPRYWPAMQVLKGQYLRIQREDMDAIKERN